MVFPPLSHVKNLSYSSQGVVWVITNEGRMKAGQSIRGYYEKEHADIIIYANDYCSCSSPALY